MNLRQRWAVVVLVWAGLSWALPAAGDERTSSPGQNVLGELARPMDVRSRRASSSHPDLDRNGDGQAIEPGGTLVLADLQGPGAITHIWTTVGSYDPFSGRNLVLRIYWDGAERPSVESPLGDFFGVGHGAHASFSSLPVAVSSWGRSRNCYWRMPFAKSARITVTNETDQRVDSLYYYVDWQEVDSTAEPIAYFHAQYRQSMPAEPGDYTILETTGRGHYVGTVYSAQQVRMGWFGEGDDRFFIDGEQTPSLRGTGTEDYFGDAWGFRAFATPFHGVSLWEGYYPGDRVTAYRWHIPDPIAFQKSLKVTIEHKGSEFSRMGVPKGSFLERPDWVSSVAFWYQTPVRELSEELPAAKDRLAPYRVIDFAEIEPRAKPPFIVRREDGRLVYMPAKEEAEIEFDFSVEQAGTYQVNGIIVHSEFGSRYQPYLDGEPMGPELDLCQTGMDPIWVSFDVHSLEAGTHTVKFVGKGASPNRRTLAPRFFAIGINALVLLRLEDMAGYE